MFLLLSWRQSHQQYVLFKMVHTYDVMKILLSEPGFIQRYSF
jgi:hypothetical protein